jgi:hypothetical protein
MGIQSLLPASKVAGLEAEGTGDHLLSGRGISSVNCGVLHQLGNCRSTLHRITTSCTLSTQRFCYVQLVATQTN